MSSVSLSSELVNLRVDMAILELVVTCFGVKIVPELVADVQSEGSLVFPQTFFSVCLIHCMQCI